MCHLYWINEYSWAVEILEQYLNSISTSIYGTSGLQKSTTAITRTPVDTVVLVSTYIRTSRVSVRKDIQAKTVLEVIKNST